VVVTEKESPGLRLTSRHHPSVPPSFPYVQHPQATANIPRDIVCHIWSQIDIGKAQSEVSDITATCHTCSDIPMTPQNGQ